MKNLILMGRKKKCWKPSSNSSTRAVTVPASLTLSYPEIEKTFFDVFFNLESGEIIYRPIKKGD